MKNVFPILAGIALLILAVGITVHLTITEPLEKGEGDTAGLAKDAIDKFSDAISTIFQSQVHINSSATVCDATPIAELAVLQRNIRMIVCYTNTALYSTKIIIADQTFQAKIGFDLGSKSSATYDPSNRVLTIILPEPKVLSLEAVAPPIYYRDDDGRLNHVTDDDRNEVLRLLQDQARTDTDTILAIGDAKQMIETRFHDLFQAYNIKVVIKFPDEPLINQQPTEPHI